MMGGRFSFRSYVRRSRQLKEIRPLLGTVPVAGFLKGQEPVRSVGISERPWMCRQSAD